MVIISAAVPWLLTLLLFAFYSALGIISLRLSKKICKRLSELEIFLMSIMIGMFFQTWVSFIAAIILKNIILGHIISICLGILFIIYNRKLLKLNCRALYSEIKKHKYALILLFMIFCLIAFLFFIRDDHGTIFVRPGAFGDWAFHMTIINSFAYNNNIPPEYPIWPGASLGYSFLIFYANALPVILGVDIFAAFNLFEGLLIFLLFFFIYSFGLRLFTKKSFSLLLVILIVFGSGIAWIYAFSDELPFLSAITQHNYGIILEKNIIPMNLMVCIESQRTGLCGWAFVFLIFILLYDELFAQKKWMSIKEYMLPLLLVGGLCFFHNYSYAILMIFFACLWVQKPSREFFLFLAGAAIIGVPQIIWTAGQTMQKGFMKITNGVYASISIHQIPAFAWFWVQNFGAVLIIAALGLYASFRIKKFKQLVLPAVLFFVISNKIQFTPWSLDNHKWFTFCYVIACIYGVLGIEWIVKKLADKRMKKKKKTKNAIPLAAVVTWTFVILVIISIIFARVMSIPYVYKNNWGLSSRADQQIGIDIRGIVPAQAVILSGDQHNGPVQMLSGRRIFEGYRGWLWSHGFDLGARDKETREMFESSDITSACKVFFRNNISYVFISDFERSSDLYKVNETFFKENFLNVYSSGSRNLYRVIC